MDTNCYIRTFISDTFLLQRPESAIMFIETIFKDSKRIRKNVLKTQFLFVFPDATKTAKAS